MAVKCILTGQTPSVLDGVTENVQTQIDDKQSKITANGILKGDGNGNIAAAEVGVDYVQKVIFYAIYNETTFAELKAAYDAGISCACKKDGVIYSLTAFDASRCTFSTSHQPNRASFSTGWHFPRLSVSADIYCQKEDDGTTTWRTKNDTELPEVEELEGALVEIDNKIYSISVFSGDGIETTPYQGGTEFNVRFSRQNLLDNWYFPRPVNQRGQTEYTGSGSSNVYGIDRWAVQFDGTKYNVANATLSSTSETNVGQMNYMLPNNEAMQFVGKQMTFSLLVDNPDGVNVTLHVRDRKRWSHLLPAVTGGGSLITTTGVFGTLNSGEGVQASFYIPHGTSIVPIAAKLELGGVQTLAHQDADGNWVLNEIPDYAEQLRRCQRYLYVQRGNMLVCGVITGAKKNLNVAVPVPVPMWRKPSLKGVPSVGGVRTIQGTNMAAEITGGDVTASSSLDAAISISLNTETFNTAEYVNNTPVMCYISNVMLSAEP